MDKRQRVRLHNALRKMPYTGILGGVPHCDSENFVDHAIAYLEALAGIQRQYADESIESQGELLQLRRQREAIRQFLGVGSCA